MNNIVDRNDEDLLEISPHNPSWWHVLLKALIGLIIGIFISFLVFIILILVWGLIEEAISNKIIGWWATNPLLPLILVIIAFLGTFIGSILLAGIYNVIFTDKYYDMGKMFSLTLFANIITFVIFIPMYVLFAGSIDELFFILAFHIMFTVFLSFCLIEFSTNPNYSAVHMLWSAIGLVIWLLIFAAVYKIIDINVGRSAQILIALPPVLVYLSLPFWHGIWEKIYYRFYMMWNNFFYIPSLTEVLVDEEINDDAEVDDINVEL